MEPIFGLTEEQRLLIVEAFSEAAAAGMGAPDCYMAAIDALQTLYPDAKRTVLAREAVRIVTTDPNFVKIVRSRG